MAIVNQMTSYDLNGKKLSFANWISNISPTDTPFISMTGKEGVTQTTFQWQTDVLRLYADSSKIKKLINWQPKVSLDEGLAKTIDWFSARPEGIKTLLSQGNEKNW